MLELGHRFHGTTVRVFERRPGGQLYIGVPLAQGGYRAVSLKHADREQAMRDAAALASCRQAGDGAVRRLTVAGLFDLYTRAALPNQSEKHGSETIRVAEMWTRYLGSDYEVRKLGHASGTLCSTSGCG